MDVREACTGSWVELWTPSPQPTQAGPHPGYTALLQQQGSRALEKGEAKCMVMGVEPGLQPELRELWIGREETAV